MDRADPFTLAGPSARASLATVPPELFTAISQHIEPQDLIRCAMTCRRLHDAVLHNSSLLYRVSLFRAGMLDAGPGADVPPLPERLRRLRELEGGWRAFNWRLKRSSLVPPGERYDLAGGVLAKPALSGPDLRGQARATTVLKLPTTSVLSRAVRAPHAAMPANHVVVDPAQDLLVFICLVVAGPFVAGGEPPANVRVYPMTLSSNGAVPHPDAAQQLFECPILPYPIDIRTVRIAEDVVGLSLDSPGILVWNWKTGEMIYCLWREQWSCDIGDFAFLTPRLIIVTTFEHNRVNSVGSELPPSVVATVNVVALKTATSSASKTLVALDFPLLQPKLGATLTITTGPHATAPEPGVHFVNDPAAEVLAFCFRHRTPCKNDQVPCFVVQRKTLFALMAACEPGTTRTLRWDEWGPAHTRLLVQRARGYPPHTLGSSRWVHGSRLVNRFQDPLCPEAASTTLLDFNTRARHGLEAGTMQLVAEPSTVALAHWFTAPVTTGLPYYATPEPVLSDRYWSWALDGQRLLAFSRSESLWSQIKWALRTNPKGFVGNAVAGRYHELLRPSLEKVDVFVF